MQPQQISFFPLRSKRPKGRTSNNNNPSNKDIDNAKALILEEELMQSNINPLLFKGLSVFVDLPDQNQKKVAEKVLTITGANIIMDPKQKTDIIVTDNGRSSKPRNPAVMKNWFLQYKNPQDQQNALKNDNLNNLNSNNTNNSDSKAKQHIISSKQIPWAFMVRPLPSVQPPLQTPNLNVNTVIVADAKGKARPLFCILNKVPEIRCKPIPKGFLFSPFMTSEEIQRCRKNLRNPDETVKVIPIKVFERNGTECFCDICKKVLRAPNEEEHRNSIEHKQNVAKQYSEVDLLALSFEGEL